MQLLNELTTKVEDQVDQMKKDFDKQFTKMLPKLEESRLVNLKVRQKFKDCIFRN